MCKIFFLYLIILDSAFKPLIAQTCPNKCSCSPSTKGLIVFCGPNLTSFPVNVPTTSRIFSIGSASSFGSSQVNNIPSLSKSNFVSFFEVIIIQISFSNVQSIDPGTFSNLLKLVKLNLKGNKISSLSRSMLAGLSRLENLVLTDNANCVLDQDVFKDLTSLKTLELGGLGLKTLGAILSTLTSLETLDLHGNNLVRLEYSSFVNLNSLNFLDVSFNDLYGVKIGMKNIFVNLKSLRLDYNPWRCNCAISWLKILPGGFAVPHRGQGAGLICDQPTKLSFRDLVNVAEKDMTCIPAQILSCNSNHVTVIEGQGVDVTCQIEGDPYPDVTWSRPDGVNVSAILMTSTKQYVNFSIPASVYTKHNGKWEVIAENYNGSSIKTIDVSILTTTIIQTTPTTITTTLSSSKPVASLFTVILGTSILPNAVLPNSIHPSKITIPPRIYPSGIQPTTLNQFQSTHSNPSSSSTSSSSISPIYIVIIVASSLSSAVFLTGICLFLIIVHKSKRKVRIAAKRRSVYSKQDDDFEMASTPVPPTPFHNMINFKE